MHVQILKFTAITCYSSDSVRKFGVTSYGNPFKSRNFLKCFYHRDWRFFEMVVYAVDAYLHSDHIRVKPQSCLRDGVTGHAKPLKSWGMRKRDDAC